MVGPVPAVLLEERDAVAEVFRRSGRPGDRGKLSDIDSRPVLLLEGADRGERLAQHLPVVFAIIDLSGIGDRPVRPFFSERVVYPLMGEAARLVHVNLIDHILHLQRRQVAERRRRI